MSPTAGPINGSAAVNVTSRSYRTGPPPVNGNCRLPTTSRFADAKRKHHRRAAATREPPKPPTRDVSRMTSNSTRIVILDEDRIMLQSLSQFLRREGYEVRTADA